MGLFSRNEEHLPLSISFKISSTTSAHFPFRKMHKGLCHLQVTGDLAGQDWNLYASLICQLSLSPSSWWHHSVGDQRVCDIRGFQEMGRDAHNYDGHLDSSSVLTMNTYRVSKAISWKAFPPNGANFLPYSPTGKGAVFALSWIFKNCLLGCFGHLSFGWKVWEPFFFSSLWQGFFWFS